MSNDLEKQAAAKAAINYIVDDEIIGVGTGSTVNYFIDELAKQKDRIAGAVASSEETAKRLKSYGIEVFDLNQVSQISVYVDGADEIDSNLKMIKGGGGCHTLEKLVATMAKTFVVIVDESKISNNLTDTWKRGIPFEVLPASFQFVSKEIEKLNGTLILRTGSGKAGPVISDSGNFILDVFIDLEKLALISKLIGVISCGYFDLNCTVIIGKPNGVEIKTKN